MAFIEARSGGPPDAPAQSVLPCEQPEAPRAHLTLLVRDQLAHNTPALADTQVRVTVGAETHTVTTDGSGLVTFVYEAAADFANAAVRVELTDDARRWFGTANVGGAPTNTTQLAIPVSGEFQLTVEVWTHKPGTGAMAWPRAWTPALNLSCSTTPPGGAAADTDIAFQASGGATPTVQIINHRLSCAAVHELSVGLFGFIADDSRVQVWTEGTERAVGDDDATHDHATFRLVADNGLRLSVSRHDRAVRLRFDFRFPQVLVVGEGTFFEYAVGLANKYEDALADPEGFRWVVATQYDVTNVVDVPDDMQIRNWETGALIAHADQHDRVETALERNLVNHGAQFDATNAGHWANAHGTYGVFDAVVFNNPHPGYGMHMCEVLGLTTAHGLSRKNGKAISVYSFGYGVALGAAQIDPYRTSPTATHYATQRNFVRGAAVGQLNHQNTRDTNIAFQYSAANTTALPLRIRDAFEYYNATAIAPAWYGRPGEFPNNQVNHYQSNVDSVGLQGYLLRSYRHHGPSVLKNGGWLFINGSAQWAATLTAGFNFGLLAVPAMTNLASWETHAAYFVYYRTNFTSTDHHPSWYSAPNFHPGEPNINNARVYGWQNP
ncbi:hypothetical protein ACN28E_04330 [Archangium lansingense]|uniref:hypothetical protein n=1 Tax=Archangium lansingense TaxID=2995310 RepID=UPI003B793ACC